MSMNSSARPSTGLVWRGSCPRLPCEHTTMSMGERQEFSEHTTMLMGERLEFSEHTTMLMGERLEFSEHTTMYMVSGWRSVNIAKSRCRVVKRYKVTEDIVKILKTPLRY